MPVKSPYHGSTALLPPQFALLTADLAIIINYIVALLVPWVLAQYRLNNPWVPIYVPVKLGLLRCFSDICKANHDVHSQRGNNNMPQWGPPGGGQGLQTQGAGGGDRVLFQVSAIFAVILLSASLLLALAGGVLEVRRMQGAPISGGPLALHVTFLGSVLVIVTVLEYLFITVAGLHGGHYEVGFWLCLSTGVVAGLLTFVQLVVNSRYETDEEYQRICLPQYGAVPTPATYPQAFSKHHAHAPPTVLVSPATNHATLS